MADKDSSLRSLLYDGPDGLLASDMGCGGNQNRTEVDNSGQRDTVLTSTPTLPHSTSGSECNAPNVNTVSSNTSTGTSSYFSSHGFSLSPSHAPDRNIGTNPLQTYSITGQHQTSTYSVTVSFSAAQQGQLSSYSKAPTQTGTRSAHSSPFLSTGIASNSGGNTYIQHMGSCALQKGSGHTQSAAFQMSTQEPACQRMFPQHKVFSSPSPPSQTTSPNMSPNQQFNSNPSDPNFMYKLSSVQSHSMIGDPLCKSSQLPSPVCHVTNPLATQNLNTAHQSSPRHAASPRHGQTYSSPNASSASPVESVAFQRQGENCASSPHSVRSAPSPCVSTHSQSSPRAPRPGSRAHSASSVFNPPSATSSINGCTSPQVSDLESEDTSISATQQSIAKSYASLTQWTSKLTAPDFNPLPHPAYDALPIPLENIDKESMLIMTPSPVQVPPRSFQSKPYHNYSRLQPGMGEASPSRKSAIGQNVKAAMVGGAVPGHKPKMKVLPNKEHRFKRTADALLKSGLWEVAMKTGNLIKRNRELQRELEQFKADALAFLKSVIKNPQNRNFIKTVLNNAIGSNMTPKNASSVLTVVVSAAATSLKLDSHGSTDGSLSGNASSAIYSGNVSDASSDANFRRSDGSLASCVMEMD